MAIIWVIIGITILAIAVPFILKMRNPKEVTLQELGISVLASIVVTLICFALFAMMVPRSTEILNGQVTDKQRVRVSCSHAYSCNCYRSCSGSGSSRTCTTICQTCYRHSYDVDWRVYNTINHYINIDRINSQGTRTPPRWNKVAVGEPFSIENSYVDYLKVSNTSVFNKRVVKEHPEYAETIPSYPHVYDYYRVGLIRHTHPVSFDLNIWNDTLRDRLKVWGAKHQLNVVIVFTKHGPDFFEYLKNQWKGGRKNDAIVVLNVDEENNMLAWGNVFSWSKNELFNTSIKAHLNSLEEFSLDNVMSILDQNVKHFERRPMEEFKYLLKDRTYAWWQILIVIILQLAVNVGVWYTISTNSVRNSTFNYRRY